MPLHLIRGLATLSGRSCGCCQPPALSHTPQYLQARLSMPPFLWLSLQAQTWMSYKDRSVAGDNWEPGKGCDCSSDLMVAETMMGQSGFPEWSWAPQALPQTPALCSMSVWKAHPGLLAGSTTLGRQQDSSELTPSPPQPRACPFGPTGDICESSEGRTRDRNSLCSVR